MRFRPEFILFVPILAGLWLAIAHAADPSGTNTQPQFIVPAYTFATLPAVKTTGTLAYVSDGLAANCADTTCTTFGTAVTGGTGALKLLVWWNGAAWNLVGK